MNTRTIERKLKLIDKKKAPKKMQFLGNGSGSKVYKGIWEGKNIAIKCFNNPTYFNYEVAAFKTLQSHECPYIVTAYGYVIDEKWLILEYMPNNLNTFLKHNTNLPCIKKNVIAYEVASGVKSLHDIDYLHRDIKSTNILIDENHHAKLCDMEFLLSIDKAEQEYSVGTDGWIAPEIMPALSNDKHNSKSTDMYSVGVVAWLLFTGNRRPHNKIVSSRDIPSSTQQSSTAVNHVITNIKCIVANTVDVPADERFSASKVVNLLRY